MPYTRKGRSQTGRAINPRITPKKEKLRARYMLRYALPHWCAEKRTKELVKYCQIIGIDEVMFFTESTNYLELETLEESRAYARILKPTIERLRKAGIEASIQLHSTMGHGDFGRDLRKKLPFQYQVDADGTESRACACPLDVAWQRYAAELYRIYASLKPRIIWVDDDFRLHNHSPVRWGCFCPLHLQAFSKRAGHFMSRSELVKSILSPNSQPSTERLAWFNLMGDSMIEAATILEHAVHEVSPETRLGLMTSLPEVHCVEGRRWHDLLKSLSGPHEPVIRPTLGSYIEGDKRELLYGLMVTLHSKALTPHKTLIAPEVENYPFTRFSKSAKYTRLQIALCQLCEIPDVTLDLYDYYGEPLSDDPVYGNMLRNNRPFFDSITCLMSAGGTPQGVRLFFHERGALFRQTENDNWHELLARRPWDFTLPLLGFSVTYGESSICAVTGDSILALEDKALHNLLSKGLLLDSSAAAALERRGLAKLIGVTVGPKMHNCFFEEILDEDFGKRRNESHTFLTTPASGDGFLGGLSVLNPVPEARSVSRILGDDGKELSSGLVLYENRLGGRVAVFPHDGQSGAIEQTYFRNWIRQKQLRSTINWLGKGSTPFFVEGVPDIVPIRIDQPPRVVLGIANLSSDPISRIQGVISGLPERYSKISFIDKRGRQRNLEKVSLKKVDKDCRIQALLNIESLDLGILVIEEK